MTSSGQVTIPEATPPNAPQMLFTVGSGSFVQYMAKFDAGFVGMGRSGTESESAFGVSVGFCENGDVSFVLVALRFLTSPDMIGPPPLLRSTRAFSTGCGIWWRRGLQCARSDPAALGEL